MRAISDARSLSLAATLLGVLACGSEAGPAADALAPASVAPSAALVADRCVNFAYQTVGDLGPYVHPVSGLQVFGAKPGPVTIAGMNGTMYSWVERFHYAGPVGESAEHIRLHHRFETAGGTSWFQTDDRAVCAPNQDGGCRVNDQMRIVAGAGVFANADGLVHNHGTLMFSEGWLDLDLRGRVCGDGL